MLESIAGELIGLLIVNFSVQAVLGFMCAIFNGISRHITNWRIVRRFRSEEDFIHQIKASPFRYLVNGLFFLIDLLWSLWSLILSFIYLQEQWSSIWDLAGFFKPLGITLLALALIIVSALISLVAVYNFYFVWQENRYQTFTYLADYYHPKEVNPYLAEEVFQQDDLLPKLFWSDHFFLNAGSLVPIDMVAFLQLNAYFDPDDDFSVHLTLELVNGASFEFDLEKDDPDLFLHLVDRFGLPLSLGHDDHQVPDQAGLPITFADYTKEHSVIDLASYREMYLAHCQFTDYSREEIIESFKSRFETKSK